MSNSKKQGQIGEDRALSYLLEKGYVLLERNYRYKKSEIDLIMKYDATVIFIEVKYRKSSRFGHPEEFVSHHQQNMILAGADQYIAKHDWQRNIRFDIVAINAKLEIEHFEDAFY